MNEINSILDDMHGTAHVILIAGPVRDFAPSPLTLPIGSPVNTPRGSRATKKAQVATSALFF